MAKRLFDILISSVAIIIIFPVFLIISALIIFLMPGPVLFRQQRVGRSGALFMLNKFRTMTVKKTSALGSFDVGNRSRITPLGRFLRNTKFDELPQLFNVLIGDMSLVGPRPEVKQWTEVYQEKWEIVHSVKPGITDYASILFRNEEEILAQSISPIETYEHMILPKKLDLNIEYINNQTFWGDIKIIFKTIQVIFLK